MIVVGGDNLIDLIQTGQSGDELSFSGMRGGSSYNTARAIGLQGQKVGFITPISRDSLGDFLADKITSDGVELLAKRHGAPTSLAVVTTSNGQPSYQFYRDGTAERQVDFDQLTDNMPATAVAFHLSSLAIVGGKDADHWAQFFNAQKQNGVFVALDPNVRPMLITDRETYLARLNGLLNDVDLLKLSDEDLEWIFPDQDFETACQSLLKLSRAAITIVTKGGDGAVAFYGGNRLDVPASPVPNLVDTVGAGDTFMATLLSELSRQGHLSRAAIAGFTQDDIQTWLGTAARAAAINCSRKGCQPPTYNEL